MRYAAIDIGTNSCRLLVAELRGGSLQPLYQALETTRVGEGVSSCGIINTAAGDRTIACLGKFRDKMTEFAVGSYRVIATSAVREAKNGKEFVAQARQQSGLEIEVIDGQEEASLSYLGVKRNLNLEKAPLVIDLGGGSTEFICLDEEFTLSLALGAVRVSEAALGVKKIRETLSPIKRLKDKFRINPLVAVGGTATSLVAIKLGLRVYEASQVHGQILTKKEIEGLYHRLENIPLTARRQIPGLQPERADIICAGAQILLLCAKALDKEEIIISDADLLQGIIWGLLAERSANR